MHSDVELALDFQHAHKNHSGIFTETQPHRIQQLVMDQILLIKMEVLCTSKLVLVNLTIA